MSKYSISGVNTFNFVSYIFNIKPYSLSDVWIYMVLFLLKLTYLIFKSMSILNHYVRRVWVKVHWHETDDNGSQSAHYSNIPSSFPDLFLCPSKTCWVYLYESISRFSVQSSLC